jgi:hypothetical protein
MVSSTRHRSEVAETTMSLKKKPGVGGGGSSVRPQQICEEGGSCKQTKQADNTNTELQWALHPFCILILLSVLVWLVVGY